ncbi:hypothetical protein BGZ76_000663 [Entomortierella beljakovae]|nr:hypothetical protein BGZ76_000663 [Entomortierella beljakovae]
MVTLQIIGSNNQSIVCVAVLLEQSMTLANNAVSYLPLALAVLSGGISLSATIMRASVGNGLLGAAATYGLPTESVLVHTPGLFDIIFYTQFMLMTGQLSVNYPSFYATFTSLFHWSFLQFSDTLMGKGPSNATDVLLHGGSGSVNQIKIPQRTLLGNNSEAASFQLSKRLDQVVIPDIGTKKATSILLQPIYSVPFTTTPITLHLLKRQTGSTTDLSTIKVSTEPSPPTSSPSSPPSPSSSHSSPSKSPSSRTTTNSKTTTTPTSTRTTPSGGKPPTQTATRTTPSSTLSTPTPSLIIPTLSDPFTNTSNSITYNTSKFGVESYAAAIGAYPSSLFLGTLTNSALAACASLVLTGALLSLAWSMAKENHQIGKTLQHALNFVAAWRVLRASSELLLYDDQATLLKYGTLYNTLAPEGTLFFLATLLARFMWGLSISMLSSFGLAQVIVLLVVEIGYVIIIGFKWPYAESTDNKFHLFMGIMRAAITGCLIAYVHSLEVSPDRRQLFAYIQMALHLAVFVVIFALVLWNFIQVCMFWKLRHLDTWRGPTKTYSFEDPAEQAERGWNLPGRPNSRSTGRHIRGVAAHQHGSGDEGSTEFGPSNNKRFTVMTYSSLGSGSQEGPRNSLQHAHLAISQHQMLQQDISDDETQRYGSPAERYRQSRLVETRRSRLIPAGASEGGSVTDDTLLDRRLDSMVTSTGNIPGSRPSTPRPHLHDLSANMDGSTKPSSHRASSPLGTDSLTQRESYTNSQRISHQQSTPDPRTRRMSDIMRDGPYLYDPRKEENTSSFSASQAADPPKTGGLFSGLMASIGTAFKFRGRNGNALSGDGSKPKPFEVMRPPRRNRASEPSSGVMDEIETGSQPGGDQLRELHSVGISRFFQESDRGYEKNSSLFVANPSAMISRTGSLVSTVSGAVPHGTSAFGQLNRNGSGTAESIRAMAYARSRGTGAGVGPGFGPSAAGASTGSMITASGVGGKDSTNSEPVCTNSASDQSSRVLGGGSNSAAGSQLQRQSAEGNTISGALAVDAPLLLQGGGTLRVSKGPEKAVQYWHKESGRYVESIAESLKEEKEEKSKNSIESEESSSPLSAQASVVPPIQTNQKSKSIQEKQTRHSSSPSIKSRSSFIAKTISSGQDSSLLSSSSPGSPTESQESPTTANVAASAGRMHEILGRMFSDKSVRLNSDHEHDSDSLLSEDTASSFSGRMSAAQQIQLLPNRDDTDARLSEDAQSLERYDMLEPVLEDSDLESEQDLDRTPRQSSLISASVADSALNETQKEVKRASSASSVSERRRSGSSLMRTFSGPTRSVASNVNSGLRSGLLKSKQNSLSNRPLAQSPLHSPSVQLGSSSISGGPTSISMTTTAHGGAPSDLSRQSSIMSGASSRMEYLDAAWFDNAEDNRSLLNRNSSAATARTEASYVTAASEYLSDEEGL